MGTRASFSGVKRPAREADNSPPSSAEVKNAWSYTSITPIRLHGVVKLSLCFSWAPRHEGVLGEWRYSSSHSLTSALDFMVWCSVKTQGQLYVFMHGQSRRSDRIDILLEDQALPLYNATSTRALSHSLPQEVYTNHTLLASLLEQG
jgi:hypothetical protein